MTTNNSDSEFDEQAMHMKASEVLEQHGLTVERATSLFIERIATTGGVPAWLSRRPNRTTKNAIEQVRAGHTGQVRLRDL
jgi:antitoxin component of RelBE/YafQ-DinJ toxin-antitoxin module